MVSQKEWMVFDLEHGDLLQISIIRHTNSKGRKSRKRSQTWYLTKYSNYFDLNPEDLQVLLGMECTAMLEKSRASSERDYSFVIAQHEFDQEDMNQSYWEGMLGPVLPKKKRKSECPLSNVRLYNINVPVNKKKLEGELYRLTKPKM